jgi:hypothetical protein
LTAGTLVSGGRILQSDGDGNLSWLSPAALAAATAWALTGNSGTDPAVNFLGTRDAQPLVIRTDNIERVRVTEAGHVLPGANETYDLGSPTQRWRDVYARSGQVTDWTVLNTLGVGNRIVVTGGGATIVGDLDVTDGHVSLGNTDNTARELRLYEPSGAGTNYTAFRARAQASNIIYTLPADLTAGTLVSGGRILQSDGDGNLSWLSPAALAAATAWALTGNSGTDPTVNFLGTRDAQPLVIRTDNIERVRVTEAGHVLPGANETYDLGSPTQRWRDVYARSGQVTDWTVLNTLGVGNRIVVTGGGATIVGDLDVTDGHVSLGNTDNTARELRLYEPSGSGTNYTAFRARAQASNIIYTLPADLTAGTLVSGGRILQSDGRWEPVVAQSGGVGGGDGMGADGQQWDGPGGELPWDEGCTAAGHSHGQHRAGAGDGGGACAAGGERNV